MVHESCWGKNKWPWKWPHQCEWVYICVPGRVEIPTLLLGIWIVAWVESLLHVWGDHRLRPQMGWNVSIEPGREIHISLYFTYPVPPILCHGSGWGVISHLCPSLWHQWWCQLGATTYEESKDTYLDPPHVLEVGLMQCFPSALFRGMIFLFRPDWMMTENGEENSFTLCK